MASNQGFNYLVNILYQSLGAKQAATEATQVQSSVEKISSISPKVAEGLQQIGTSTDGVGKGMIKIRSAVEDFTSAMKRAIIVAPVWMATRAAMQAVFGTIQDGVKQFVEFDRIMIKNRAVILTTTGDINSAFKEVETTIREFSIRSGASIVDLGKAFYRFGTLGIQYQDAIGGAIAATKLALATQGDADTIARSLAQAYKLLGDTMDATLSPMAKQEVFAAKIYKLWQVNAFESNEFAQSLNNFISTANIANFTADQTAVLLASLGSAGITGAKGGTLLKTAIFKLVENLDMLAGKLGLAVNPELETTFDILMRVLGSINQLSKTSGIPAEAIKSISEIFGGVRGAQAISALNALFPELQKNLQLTTTEATKFQKEFQARIDETRNSVSGQIEIFNNLKKTIGESLIIGIANGRDFADSLKIINNNLDNSIKGAKEFGEALRFLAVGSVSTVFGIAYLAYWDKVTKKAREQVDIHDKIQKALRGELSLKQAENLISEISTKYNDKNLQGRQNILAVLELEKQALTNKKPLMQKEIEDIKAVTESSKEYTNELNNQLNKLSGFSTEFQERVKLSQKEYQYQLLTAAGANDLELSYIKLNDLVSILVDRYNRLDKVIDGSIESIDEMSALSLFINGNFEDFLGLFKEMKLQEEDMNGLLGEYNNLQKSSINQVNTLISHELELARIRGASGKELFDLEMSLKSIAYGEDKVTRSIENQLRLKREIVAQDEKRNQLAKGATNLYKIAQKEGLAAAQAVAEVMSGTQRFSEFSRTGDILKKYLPSEFEGLKSQQYFTESVPGFKFPEELKSEAAIQLNQRLQSLEQNLERLPQPSPVNMATNISQININLPEDSLDTMAETTGRQVTERLKTDTNLQKTLAKLISPYLTTQE
jgi:hypothetical protein